MSPGGPDLVIKKKAAHKLEPIDRKGAGILENISGSSYMLHSAPNNYKDILKLTGINNKALLQTYGYIPRVNNGNYSNPDYYYLPHFTTYITL